MSIEENPLKLIDELIRHWRFWDDYEEYYLTKLAPGLVKDPESGDRVERSILASLRRHLSEQEWSELPKMIAEKRAGIHRETQSELLLREMQEREKQEAERIRLENEERQGAMQREIRCRFSSDFLSATPYFYESCADLMTVEQFETMKCSFVESWMRAQIGSRDGSKKLPDDEQIAAISSVNGNIQVVARAGSGKTTTLVNRSLFLLKHCRVDPSEILLLAFNRKAAMEIRKSLLVLLVPEASQAIQHEIDKARMHTKAKQQVRGEVEAEAVEAIAEKFAGRLPHVMTFHALAHAIVHPQGKILFDGQNPDSLGLSRAVQDVIDEFMRHHTTRDRVRDLMMDHFRDDWDKIVDGGFNLGMDDMLALKRSLPRETLGGNLVKSGGEKAIADFLFEHGIPYKYERNHWWSGVNYKPDFTIFSNEEKGKESGVIIEYFGMAGDQKYDQLTEEKQKYWAEKRGWSLLSLFPSDLTGVDKGKFNKSLATELENRGVRCSRLSEEEIWLRVKHRALDRFTKATTSFIGRCRKKYWSAEDLADHSGSHKTSTDAERKFINLVSEIFAVYLERLAQTGDDDFDGMMQKAADVIESGSTAFLRKSGGGDIKSLRFICIDEFQDFSELFHRLINAMRKANERMTFFCVGDDWQAINGFAGSELRFFQKFSDYFSDVNKLHISTNYRSARKIVEIGNDLMFGRGMPAKNSKAEAGDAWICDISKFEPTRIEKQRHPSDLITPLAARLAHRFTVEGRKIVFLARRNGLPWYFNTGDDVSSGRGLDDFLLRVRACLPEELRNMVSISTAHKYKGLEKPVVVVLDAVVRSYPLIHPDWPFFRIFGDSPDSLSSDDRRLFYVALTRAVESLVVITDSGAQSPFLDEIRARRALSPIPWSDFPPVADGDSRRLLLKIKDASHRKYSDGTGTFSIKDLLHACRYQFHGVSKCWEKSILRERFDLHAIQSELWVKSASGIEINLYDETEKLLASYRVDNGFWRATISSTNTMANGKMAKPASDWLRINPSMKNERYS